MGADGKPNCLPVQSSGRGPKILIRLQRVISARNVHAVDKKLDEGNIETVRGCCHDCDGIADAGIVGRIYEIDARTERVRRRAGSVGRVISATSIDQMGDCGDEQQICKPEREDTLTPTIR